MKKIALSFMVLIAIAAVLVSCSPKTDDTVTPCEKSKYVYLVAGFDAAAENTDVLFTISYDFKTNTVCVAQIPRDTYFGFGKAQNKINQFYAVRRLYGEDKKSAMQSTTDAISEAFGAEFDGYLGITLDTFKKTVDALGGIDIEVPSDMVITADDGSPSLILKQGINHITGNDAELFIRYRQGYIMGDLGRIDAQKLFLNALFRRIAEGVPFSTLFDIAMSVKNELVTNVKIMDSLSLLMEALKAEGDKTTYYVTMPGEPLQSKNGLSFYVLNRKSAAEISKKYMFANKEFDRNRNFLNTNEAGFINIYEDDSIEYREYSNKTLNDINITTRND